MNQLSSVSPRLALLHIAVDNLETNKVLRSFPLTEKQGEGLSALKKKINFQCDYLL